MSYLGFATLLVCLATSSGVAAGTRSGQWQANVHTVGETFPKQGEVRSLLGSPDSVAIVTVTGPRYAPRQTLQCASIKPGTSLVVWRYKASPSFTYLLYFKGTKMVCFGSE